MTRWPARCGSISIPTGAWPGSGCSAGPTAAARTELAARFLRLLTEAQLASLLGAAGLPAAEADRIVSDAGAASGDLPPSLREQLRLGS